MYLLFITRLTKHPGFIMSKLDKINKRIAELQIPRCWHCGQERGISGGKYGGGEWDGDEHIHDDHRYPSSPSVAVIGEGRQLRKRLRKTRDWLAK